MDYEEWGVQDAYESIAHTAREEGREEGRKIGRMISILETFGFDDETIIKRISEEFNLTYDEVKELL